MDDLAADIDQSARGLVDDYPGQCFPADVVAAIEMIRRLARQVIPRGRFIKRWKRLVRAL